MSERILSAKNFKESLTQIEIKYNKIVTGVPQVVLAAYSQNFDQKDIIRLEIIPSFVRESDLVKYGLWHVETVPEFSVREYVFFVPNADVFESTEILAEYYDSFCETHLPPGTSPLLFALLFIPTSFEDYEHYFQMLQIINSKFNPLFTFNSMVIADAKNKARLSVEEEFGSNFSVIVYDEVLNTKLLGFVKNPSVKGELYKEYFLNSLDSFAKSLASDKKPMLYIAFSPQEAPDIRLFELGLAYLNYRHRIPILCNVALQNAVMEKISSFYFPFNIGTLCDTLELLRSFPHLGMIRRELYESVGFFPPDSRSVSAEVMYLVSGEVVTETVDLMSLLVHDRYDSDEFYSSVKQLERALQYEVFLHCGNTICVEKPGSGMITIFVKELFVKYTGYIIPLDLDFEPLRTTLSLDELSHVVPLPSCIFTGNGSVLFQSFRQKLGLIAEREKLELPSPLQTLPKTPILFEGGEAVVHYHLHRCSQQKYIFKCKDKRMLLMCSYQNVVFRNNLIKQLMEHMYLSQLRLEHYLTIYGSNLTQFPISENLFKSYKGD